jgi:hypothetical protein
MRCVPLHSNGAKAHYRLQPHYRSNSSYSWLLTRCLVHNPASFDTLSEFWYSLAEIHGTMALALHGCTQPHRDALNYCTAPKKTTLKVEQLILAEQSLSFMQHILKNDNGLEGARE